MSSGRVAPEEVLAVCENTGTAREPVTASEVADELGCTRRTALNKLDELADRGDLQSKKVGARSRVWWRPAEPSGSDDCPESQRVGTDDAIESPPVGAEDSLPDRSECNPLETELDEMFSRISDGFYALDDQWRFTYVSERAEELIDYSSTNLVGENIWEVFEDVNDTKLSDEYRTAMDTQDPTSFEFYDELLDAWFEVHVYPSETGLSVYFQDITDRKQRQRKLKKSERRYRSLVESFPNGSVGLFDEDLRYTAVGGQLLDTLDLSPEERLGKRISELHSDDLLAEVEPYFRAALEGEANTFAIEYRDRHLSAHTLPVRNADDEVDAGMLVVQDVTERKEAQRELRESESKFRMLAENLDEIVWMATGDGEEFVYINPVFEEIWGMNREDLYDEPLSFLETVHPDDRERIRDAFAALPESEFDEEYRLVQSDGEVRWVHARGTKVHGEDGEMTRVVGIGEDVTDQKEHERELERALDLLERTERIADVGGWEIDVDTQDVFWTDHIFELLEVTGDEEPPLDEALDMYHEEDHAIVEDAVENALGSGDPFDVEVRVRTDSGDIRWLRLQGVPETVDDEVVSFRGAAQDVTERVERERELEERNKRLDSFASMLAHELRNPVTVGQIYSQNLPEGVDSEAVEYVTEAFDRIEDMIDVLLVLTRGREAIGDRMPVQLADAAHEAWDNVEAPDATLDVESDQMIQADETYIRHLLRNLFDNAVVHGGRDVTITVGDLPTGFYVADDGPGIPADERDAVFEVGYTTAAEQGGTGLGLAFVQKLADVYEWEYSVTESATGGARFEFTNMDPDSST